jgi:hypothetical protein
MKRTILTALAGLTLVAACTDTLTRPSDDAATPNGRFTPQGIRKDDIANALDPSIDATAEAMPLNVGTNGTTTLYVQPRNGDGKNGCNLQSTTEAVTVNVVSSDPSVATVSPSSVTFTSCPGTTQLTITPLAQGTTSISVSEPTANNTGATFNGAPATFTVTVAPPANTAPRLSITGVTGGASYPKDAVPTAMCSVTDAEDGPSSFAATLSVPDGQDGTGNQTASCSYTDGGGLTASGSVTYGIVASPPVIGSTLTPPSADGDNGWYRTNVSLTWSVTELESPNTVQKVGCVDQNITTDQVATTYSCSATSAGGSAVPVTVSIKRDGTAPTNVAFVGGPVDGETYYVGYNNVPAAPTCTADDATSLLASCNVAGYGAGVGTHVMTATATDNAGNSATATRSYTVRTLTLDGFYQPVDMNGVFNTVKAGSTVPLKFRIFAGSTELVDTRYVASFNTAKVACDATAPTDEVEITSTGGTSLRYDVTGQQFVQNWLTPKTAGICYRVTMTATGGRTLEAFFKLK